MAVNGIALGSVLAGSLFLYAGITGKNIPAAARAVISGQSPASVPQANPIAGTPNPIGTPGPGGTAGGRGGGSGGSGWSAAMLGAGGWPQTQANINSVNSWQAREGGGGQNNPLNTTQAMPGATDFNSVGVKNYPSVAEGVRATVITLNNGLYGDIVMLLASGQGLCGHTLAGLSKWSGGGYSNVC